MEMKFYAESSRLVIRLRKRNGMYAMLMFNPMDRDEALALLPEYGYSPDEVVDMATYSYPYPVAIDSGHLASIIEWAATVRRNAFAEPWYYDRRQTEALLRDCLQLLLNGRATVGTLPKALVTECQLFINQHLNA